MLTPIFARHSIISVPTDTEHSRFGRDFAVSCCDWRRVFSSVRDTTLPNTGLHMRRSQRPRPKLTETLLKVSWPQIVPLFAQFYFFRKCLDRLQLPVLFKFSIGGRKRPRQVLTPAQNRYILDMKFDARCIVLRLFRSLPLTGSTPTCMQAMPSEDLCMVCRRFAPTYRPQITTIWSCGCTISHVTDIFD